MFTLFGIILLIFILIIMSKRGLYQTIIVIYLRKMNILNLGSSGFSKRDAVLIKLLTTVLLWIRFFDLLKKPEEFNI